MTKYAHRMYIIVLWGNYRFFKGFFFIYGPFLKSFFKFVTVFLLCYVVVFWLGGMWGLSSPTKDRACTPCPGRQSPNHWTTGEVPQIFNFVSKFILRIIDLQEISKTQHVEPYSEQPQLTPVAFLSAVTFSCCFYPSSFSFKDITLMPFLLKPF